MNKLMVSAAASLALLAAAPVALAQQGQNASPETTQSEGYKNPAAAGTQKTNYSDAQLKQFIEAQEGLGEVRETYIPKIEKATDQTQAKKLQAEANQKMVSIIKDAGMDIPTYNAIATAYNSEPSVRNRVDALM
ncbi:DUF4168 domain-containing protein [Marinobacter sp. C2H3]|uniref:DUF4168 domain-containing protein n=1 Tax=Marinobacter sp. C2H3 TaxID=3119003 RepID=UPI00300F5DB9